MYTDIMELEDDAVKVKATFKKLLSYASAFSYDMERLDKAFASGRYGPEWTFSRWLITKCRISQTIAFRMIKDFNKTLSDDQRNRVTWLSQMMRNFYRDEGSSLGGAIAIMICVAVLAAWALS